MRDDEQDACYFMQNSLVMKRKSDNTEVYIKFISYFGPALTGVSFWNNNKTTKSINDLLTISDEAFIHLCIINYSATWKAQDKKKQGFYSVKIPVSIVYCLFKMQHYNCKQLANSIVVASLLDSQRPLKRQMSWLAMNAETMSCHVVGLKMVFTHSMHLPKKSATTAKKMEMNLKRHSK